MSHKRRVPGQHGKTTCPSLHWGYFWSLCIFLISPQCCIFFYWVIFAYSKVTSVLRREPCRSPKCRIDKLALSHNVKNPSGCGGCMCLYMSVETHMSLLVCVCVYEGGGIGHLVLYHSREEDRPKSTSSTPPASPSWPPDLQLSFFSSVKWVLGLKHHRCHWISKEDGFS